MQGKESKSELKISKFVHIFKSKNYYSLFHSLLFELIYIDQNSIELIEKFNDGLSLNEIENNFPSLINSQNLLLVENLIKSSLICSEQYDIQLLEKTRQKFTGKPRINLMYLILTDECNFRCKYCFVEQLIPDNHKSIYMTEEVAKASIDLFTGLSGKTASPSIIFYGGEPLLNIDVFEYSLVYIKKMISMGQLPQDTKISIVTNGSCVTPRVIDLVKEHNVSISISLDGPQEIHDNARLTTGNRGTFLLAYNAIQRIKDAGLNPGISCTISKFNYQQLEEINTWLVNDLHINGLGYNLPHSNPTFPDNEEITRIATKKLIKIYETNRKLGVYEDRMMRKVKSFVQKKIHAYDCAGCGQQLVISPEGLVGVCHAFLGNKKYFIDSIDNLIGFDPVENSVFTEWSKRSPLNMEECLGCPALGICGGGCPANAYFNDGDIWSIDKEYCSHSLQILDWIISDLSKKDNTTYLQ